MQEVYLRIPTDIVYQVETLCKHDEGIESKLRTSAAIGLFVSGEITLAAAAQLAESHIADFISYLSELNIPAFKYTKDMLEDDFRFAKGQQG